MSDLFGEISEKLIVGQIDDVANLTQKAVDAGYGAQEILEKGLLAGMEMCRGFYANLKYIRQL